MSFLICFLHFLHFSSLIHCLKSKLDESLEAILHEHAFRVMLHRRPHTGALYNASLPVPYVKRLLIVYHNLGNCSSLYYTLSGYSLKTPVIGFLVYDASRFSSSNMSKLELDTRGKLISVGFQNSAAIKQSNQRGKCAFFGDTGEVSISEMSAPDVCCSRNQGHFSIVVPFKKQQTWPFWIMGFLAGFVGLILVGLAATMAVRSFLGKRTQEMEKEADEGEYLQTYWITSSKMPRAEVTRTQPILESTTLPNPKLSWYA